MKKILATILLAILLLVPVGVACDSTGADTQAPPVTETPGLVAQETDNLSPEVATGPTQEPAISPVEPVPSQEEPVIQNPEGVTDFGTVEEPEVKPQKKTWVLTVIIPSDVMMAYGLGMEGGPFYGPIHQHEFPDGTMVIVSGYPATSISHFLGWEVDWSSGFSTEQNIAFIMDRDKSITMVGEHFEYIWSDGDPPVGYPWPDMLLDERIEKVQAYLDEIYANIDRANEEGYLTPMHLAAMRNLTEGLLEALIDQQETERG